MCHKHFLGTYSEPGTVGGTGNIVRNTKVYSEIRKKESTFKELKEI